MCDARGLGACFLPFCRSLPPGELFNPRSFPSVNNKCRIAIIVARRRHVMWLSFVAQVLGTFVVAAATSVGGVLVAADRRARYLRRLNLAHSNPQRDMLILFVLTPAASAAATYALTTAGASHAAGWWQIFAAAAACGFTSGFLMETALPGAP